MAYCTISDVNSYVPQAPFTAQSTPTQAQVEVFITDISNQLDLSLGNLGYVVPVVDGDKALTELKKVNAWGALGVAMSARLTAVAPEAAVGTNVWTKMFKDWLKCLADPDDPYELDSTRTGKAVVKPTGEMQRDTTNLFDQSFDYLNYPPFTMDQKL